MPKHGKIDCFDPTETNWTSYVEKLEYFTTIPADKQKSSFLAVCGSTTFELAKSLVQPDTLADTSFTDILGALKNHYAPEPSPIIQRFKFNSRQHIPGESIATYIAALRVIGEHCEFGPTLNDMIRDRLVCGVNDRAIQRRLLQQSKLDYKTAYDIAIAMESASKNALDLFAGGAITTQVKNLRSVRDPNGLQISTSS
uniref:Retrotransposon gag domain-containing protein n=1 Tax=Amphimedon queenslandica TaxID=400682 RepID=A0A1X7T5X9_AMPQE